MIKQRLKSSYYLFYSLLNSCIAKISLISINDGFYSTKKDIPYISQFIDVTKEAEIDEIKADISKLYLHGYKALNDFVFWGRRICGIICIKMILNANGLAIDLKVYDILQLGLKLKGYIVNNEDGEFVDVGWFHKPLLKLGQSLGLKGAVKNSQVIENLALEVVKGNFVIVSVRVPDRSFLKKDGNYFDDNYQGTIHGHLILLTGVAIKNHKPIYFTAHNPTGYKNYEKNSRISSKTMKRIFTGRIILFYS